MIFIAKRDTRYYLNRQSKEVASDKEVVSDEEAEEESVEYVEYESTIIRIVNTLMFLF